MAIVWRAEMSIDGGLIDDDHKCLIALVNEVEFIRIGPTLRSELENVLARLEAYARIHFEREERLQIAIGFIYSHAHHRRHEAILREANILRDKFEKLSDAQQIKAFRVALCGFLQHWLIDHILKVDRLMKPFVSEMRLHSAGSVTLAKAVQLSQERAPAQPMPHPQLPLPSRS